MKKNCIAVFLLLVVSASLVAILLSRKVKPAEIYGLGLGMSKADCQHIVTGLKIRSGIFGDFISGDGGRLELLFDKQDNLVRIATCALTDDNSYKNSSLVALRTSDGRVIRYNDTLQDVSAILGKPSRELHTPDGDAYEVFDDYFAMVLMRKDRVLGFELCLDASRRGVRE